MRTREERGKEYLVDDNYFLHSKTVKKVRFAILSFNESYRTINIILETYQNINIIFKVFSIWIFGYLEY